MIEQEKAPQFMLAGREYIETPNKVGLQAIPKSVGLSVIPKSVKKRGRTNKRATTGGQGTIVIYSTSEKKSR